MLYVSLGRTTSQRLGAGAEPSFLANADNARDHGGHDHGDGDLHGAGTGPRTEPRPGEHLTHHAENKIRINECALIEDKIHSLPSIRSQLRNDRFGLRHDPSLLCGEIACDSCDDWP